MSLTRSVCQELCEFVQNKPSSVLGQKFFDLRAVFQAETSYKTDKFETRVIALSKFRVFLLQGKTPGSIKIDRSFHVLTIRSIQIVSEDELALTIDEGGSRRRVVLKGNPANTVATHFLSAIKHYFPDIGPVLRNLVDVEPKTLWNAFDEIKIEVTPRPCHSFRRTYAALCDYFDQPYREEVSWDVEKIYTINQITELRIEDFSHLLPKDLLPIVGVLQYSSYFTGLTVDGLKLPPDLVDVILSVIRRSQWLTHLRLVNCGLPKDFITLFCSAVQQNVNLPLEILNLAKNVFDDKKGFHALSTCMPRLVSLREVYMNECGLTDKCCSLLSAALYGALSPNKISTSMQLTHLCLSKNSLNGDSSSLVNLVSLCNSLRVLDVSDTQLSLDKLWPALKYGGLQVERLILSGCQVGSKKVPPELSQTVKEFFAMAVGLVEVDFSHTVLPTEVLKAMLLGLACNQQLKPFTLTLNGSVERGAAPVLEAGLPGVSARVLSLRDNNFEAEMLGVVSALAGMPELKRLDVGGSNLTSLRRSGKQQHVHSINKILLELVKLVGDDGHLEELVLSDARLGAHLSVLLNTLGATPCLRHLDISANEMGNFGARILSKALQLNASLRTILIDGNHITADGFADIASAIQSNYTLVTLPYPVLDACEAIVRSDKAKTLNALSQIETVLERNNAHSAPASANFKRALFTLNQQSDGMSWDSVCAAEGVLRAVADQPLPLKLRADTITFVEQLRTQMRAHLKETFSHGDEEPNSRAITNLENLACDRLKELLVRDIGSVYAEWKWRSACSTAEGVLRSGGCTNSGSGSMTGSSSHGGGSPSSAMASPRTFPRQDGHRPRSIVGDLSSHSGEAGLTLEAPPKPSALVHLAKGRPKPQRRAQLGKERSASTPSDDMGRSVCEVVCETDEEERKDESGDERTKKPLSDRPMFRVAMLPEAAAMAAQLRPAADRGIGSPKFGDKHEQPLDATGKAPLSPNDESPPPLPRRNKIPDEPSSPAPPCLPPKPSDSRFAFGPVKISGLTNGRADGNNAPLRTGVAQLPHVPPPDSRRTEDDENANIEGSPTNRRSVADMTRLFNR